MIIHNWFKKIDKQIYSVFRILVGLLILQHGYQKFFGTDENPMKPVRSFVQIAGLVVDGWLVEIEIRAARVPD